MASICETTIRLGHGIRATLISSSVAARARVSWLGAMALLALLACPSVSHSQDQPAVIRIGEDRLLSPNGAQFPMTEPHLSAHPTDPNQLLVSALSVKAGRPSYSFDCALFSSLDGGTSWSHTELGFGMCGNTWSTILPDRSTLFVALTEPGGLLRYRADMRLYRSDSAGTTWPGPPYEFGPGFDYPKILHDPAHAVLYVVGSRAVRTDGRIRHSLVVAHSTDGGGSFADSVHLAPSENTYEAQVPVTLSGGDLIVPFTEHRSAAGKPSLPTWRSWLVVSQDRGQTFSTPRLITEGCVGDKGWPYLAADGTWGPYRDRLYWLCARQQLPGVWLRYSDDVGARWSDWLRVDQETEATSAVVYAVAVNREGTIGVMWLSRTNSANPCSQVVFSASVDGGRSFQPPVRVSTESSCPSRDPRNAAAHAHRPLAGGDYNGLAATADGLFHLVWADARDGMYRLRHASARVELP